MRQLILSLTIIFLLSDQIICNYLKSVFFSETPLCTSELECRQAKLKLDSYCATCTVILPMAKFLILTDLTKVLEKMALAICVGPDLSNTKMCQDIINTYKSTVYKVLIKTPLSDEELCHAFLECKPVNNKALNWTINLPDTKKPEPMQPQQPLPFFPTIRILHLTDIHFDLEYKTGSLADCDQILCCRNQSTSMNKSKSVERLAGAWGDYRYCGLPQWTLESMFDHISKKEEFDFIYWTGDLGPHSVWEDSKENQLEYFKNLRQMFEKYFPNKKIYSTVGNHDTEPDNLYPLMKTNSMSWLYDALYPDWQRFGAPESQKKSILKRGAFYTTELFPGLRLFSLNNAYCYAYNFWMFINSVDPLDQLKLLVQILQESENKGEKVHIIGHINPSGCMRSFSENYYKIVNRYESTIVGQFFGHTHNDQFEIFYDLENLKRPVGIAYMTGSITTYPLMNPAYRIFEIDGAYRSSSYQILDYETYFMNLTEANLKPKSGPVWRREYSAKRAYNLKSLLPSEWNNFIESLWNDVNNPLFDVLYRHFSKSYDQEIDCDFKCRRSFLCKFKQARSDFFIRCY